MSRMTVRIWGSFWVKQWIRLPITQKVMKTNHSKMIYTWRKQRNHIRRMLTQDQYLSTHHQQRTLRRVIIPTDHLSHLSHRTHINQTLRKKIVREIHRKLIMKEQIAIMILIEIVVRKDLIWKGSFHSRIQRKGRNHRSKQLTRDLRCYQIHHKEIRSNQRD
jgi:hypothetical protein